MNINRENIEQYMHKYNLGLLSEKETDELFEYIESHINEINMEKLNIFFSRSKEYLTYLDITSITLNDKENYTNLMNSCLLNILKKQCQKMPGKNLKEKFFLMSN